MRLLLSIQDFEFHWALGSCLAASGTAEGGAIWMLLRTLKLT